MSRIFELTICVYEDEARRTYPIPIAKERLGQFSTLELAKAFIRDAVLSGKALFELGEVVCFTVDEISLDSAFAYHHKRVYLANGTYYGAKNFFPDAPPPEFKGRPTETRRFKVGDLVEFIVSHPRLQLQLGIVTATPFTPEEVSAQRAQNPKFVLDEGDDVYLVDYFNGEDRDHKHLTECELRLPKIPIPDDLHQTLIGLLVEC